MLSGDQGKKPKESSPRKLPESEALEEKRRKREGRLENLKEVGRKELVSLQREREGQDEKTIVDVLAIKEIFFSSEEEIRGN